ncbi:MAG TPA: VOC family protein, partial [Flavobacteriales bacterium]|nr:VOC family protein [Flavobacteriales bacterium]
AISFIINCMDQDELDHYWEKLSEGGDRRSQQCGWLKDRFGLSWQVVPVILGDLLQDSDRTRADRVMKALLQMKKLDISALQNAYDGKRTQYA